MADSFRRVSASCYALATIIVLYWVAWFAHRSLVASENTRVYVNFEQAFPLADGFIVACLVLAALSLRRGSARALLFLLLGAGGGFYLFSMDVLFDLEHGIWFKGANGAIEFIINVLTLLASILLTRWTWSRRHDLGASGENFVRADG